MRSYIEKRLENLIGEHANGQTAIRNLEAQLTAMRETVTRINGAITLCQEALRDVPAVPSDTLEAARPFVNREPLVSDDRMATTPRSSRGDSYPHDR